jgi:hypothetical protein
MSGTVCLATTLREELGEAAAVVGRHNAALRSSAFR